MKYKIILLLLASVFIVGCGNTPIFTEMSTNRLKIVIKGTLETDSVSYLTAMPTSPDSGISIQDDSVDLTGSNDDVPTSFMFDIAELRLNGKKFANYRQVFEFSLAGDGVTPSTSEPEPFFNGTGVELKNDDPGEGTYSSVQVYIRKMIFDNAMVYGSGLVYENPAAVIFNEEDRSGFDFNQLQVNSHWDSLRLESGEILRNFPVEVPIIGGLQYSYAEEETVLEIRFVIKNFIKKYQFDYYDEGIFKTCHYYALSDWLRDVRSGENAIGRNLQAVARAYIPGKTGEVTVAAGAGSYVIAVPSTESITDYGLSGTGTVLRSANNCDLPAVPVLPGAYIEAWLDYYLKYEKYKNEWNAKIGSCSDFEVYKTGWDNYETEVGNFKIAPYVAFSLTGSVTFKNMAPGKYNFYQVSKPSSYGALFLLSDFAGGLPSAINGVTPVEVTSGSSQSI